jgi:plastocyanin
MRIGRRLSPAMILAVALVSGGCGSSSSHTPKHSMSMSMSMSMSHSAGKSDPQPISASTVKSGHVTITISNFAFSPTRITVKAGTHITWTNHDQTAHTATANDNSFDTGTIAPKASRTVDFKRPGVYKYHCAFHAFMTGTVVVKP